MAEAAYIIEIAMHFIFFGNFMGPATIIFSQILFDYGLHPARYNQISMIRAKNAVKMVTTAPKPA
jgi:hypothetical protein